MIHKIWKTLIRKTYLELWILLQLLLKCSLRHQLRLCSHTPEVLSSAQSSRTAAQVDSEAAGI